MFSHTVAHMREICLPGVQPTDKLQGTIYIQVGMVGIKMQGIDHHDFHPIQFLFLYRLNSAHIGDVSKITEAKAKHWQFSVQHLYGDDFQFFNIEWGVFVYGEEFHHWGARVSMLFFKDIRKAFFQLTLNGLRGVNRQLLPGNEVERPYIVHADDMIIMFMGNQKGVQPGDPLTQHLLAKIGATINAQAQVPALNQC